jgi:hypothetical protein
MLLKGNNYLLNNMTNKAIIYDQYQVMLVTNMENFDQPILEQVN